MSPTRRKHQEPPQSLGSGAWLIPATARIALTGTPVENRLVELWSIVDWVVPGLLGSLEQFKRSVAVPIERDGDPRATRRLATTVAPFLLRRRKSDPGIAPELPPKTERDVVVPLTAEQVTLYKATTAQVLLDLKDNEGLARHGLVLKLLTALKQITNHPAHYLRELGPLDGRSGKLDALDAIVDSALDGAESTLIFTQYVAMANLIHAHLSARGDRVEVLHGGLSSAKRQDLVDRFQAGDPRVLVLSLKAGGTGLNLTAATQVVHYDRWWNPAVEDQATDRAYRIGQDKPVTVHRLITEGTVEDRVAQLLAEKRALADRVVGGAGEGWIGNLNDEELAALVSLDEPLPLFSDGVAR
ncbi:MAG: DEAD/DEAH box helicase [Acidimicrobiales bacterium]